MQLSVVFATAALLVSGAWSMPSYGSASPAQAMLKRQYENTDWGNMLVARDDHMIVQPEKRIVYNPHITQPSAASIWHAGQVHHVKWSTADMPDQARTYTGVVKLGYLPADGEGGENLHWTLARDFPILAGIVEIKLPDDLQPRSDYIIVLMGDSGNASPKFQIQAPATLVDVGAGVVAQLGLK